MNKNNDLEKLGEIIKEIGGIEVDSTSLLCVKNNVLTNIQNGSLEDELIPASISKLANQIRKILNDVCISVNEKAKVRENVLDYASSHSGFRFSFSRFFTAHKKAWASFMVFILLLNVFVFVDGKVNVTEARKFTVLKEVSGDVFVQRDSETLKALTDFVLEEGDIVKTNVGSRASIRFFNDSVSRLHENTEVVLSRLYLDLSSDLSEIVVDVNEGNLWSRVCKFVPDKSAFTVSSDVVVAKAYDNAAFNVSSSLKEGVKVDVFENKVNVEISEKPLAKSLNEGLSVTVKNTAVSLSLVSVNDDWIDENLNEDEKHIIKVAEEAKEEIVASAGVGHESILHSVKRMKEDTKLLLTFDDIEKEKIELEVAESRLLEAEAAIVEGEVNEQVLTAFSEFQVIASSFAESVLKLRDTEPVKYIDLSTYLRKKLNKHRRNMVFIEPDSDEIKNDSPDVFAEEAEDVSLEEVFIKPLTPYVEQMDDLETELGEDVLEVNAEELPPILNIYREDLESKKTQNDS